MPRHIEPEPRDAGPCQTTRFAVGCLAQQHAGRLEQQPRIAQRIDRIHAVLQRVAHEHHVETAQLEFRRQVFRGSVVYGEAAFTGNGPSGLIRFDTNDIVPQSPRFLQ